MILTGRLYGWLLGALAALATLAGIYLKGRSAGRTVEQTKATERDLETERAKAETIQEVSDVQIEVSRLPVDAVRERLRERWSRD